jgi:hypothetical protein
MNDFNKNDYGLVLKYNDWEDRQRAMEEFVTYAKGKGAVFVTCKQLIDKMKEMNTEGEAIIQGTTAVANSEFKLYRDGALRGDTILTTGDMDLKAGPNTSGAQPVFRYDFDKGTLDGMTHLSLSYKSRTATAVRLVYDREGREETREVILSHRYSPVGIDARSNNNYNSGTMRESGKIPLTAFDFEQYFTGVRNYSSINTAEIKRIEIAPLAPANNPPVNGAEPTFSARTSDFDLRFQVANLTIHTGTKWNWTEPDLPSSMINVAQNNGRALSLAGITNNALKLNIAQAGKYDVKVFSANGRLVQSFNATSLTAGVNTLKLNNLAKGVYMIQIQGIDNKQKLAKSALVM